MSSVSKLVATRAARIQTQWANAERWGKIMRDYSAEDVAKLQGSYPATYPFAEEMSNKLWQLLQQHKAAGTATATFGALDPVQVERMASHGVETIYVSGWQSSSTASSSDQPGPDLADYPSNTVPNKVKQLTSALQFHDRRHFHAADPNAPFKMTSLPPIVGDGDTGHGGLTAVMRLTQMFIQSGAAGVHFEDQRPGSKKCGHMGGKVLVSTREHADRLRAARLQADILNVPLVIVARTDAEAAKLIDSDMDPTDHPFIIGQDGAGNETTYWALAESFLRKEKGEGAVASWREACAANPNMALTSARQLASEIAGGAVSPEFDWTGLRDYSGFYRFQSGVEACVARARAFAPHADILWMETAKPGLAQATQFAAGMQGLDKLLAYNLSPSFNWDDSGMTDAQIAGFVSELGKLGFTWQFITLAGFHGSGLMADRMARNFAAPRNMLAYVQEVQRCEREEGVDVLKHQTWSGAGLVDATIELVLAKGDADGTSILGSGSTEAQFGAAPTITQAMHS